MRWVVFSGWCSSAHLELKGPRALWGITQELKFSLFLPKSESRLTIKTTSCKLIVECNKPKILLLKTVAKWTISVFAKENLLKSNWSPILMLNGEHTFTETSSHDYSNYYCIWLFNINLNIQQFLNNNTILHSGFKPGRLWWHHSSGVSRI